MPQLKLVEPLLALINVWHGLLHSNIFHFDQSVEQRSIIWICWIFAKYLGLQNKYQCLKDLEINDNKLTTVLPIHVTLGVNNYTKIKTQKRPRVGLEGEPVAQIPKVRLVVVSPGNSSAVTNLLFSKASLYDYQNISSLDCFGVEENHLSLMILCVRN